VSALHFNENAKREVRKTKHGVEQYSVCYPKGRKGEPVVKDVKTEQTFGK
jgi:receptor-type tyrosine-protein phosphatase zeta